MQSVIIILSIGFGIILSFLFKHLSHFIGRLIEIGDSRWGEVIAATSPDVIKQIPLWIQNIIKKYEKVEFDRAHLIGFGDSSIDFEFVYFVSDPDFKVAAHINESILIDILIKFNHEGVSFAFPTRTRI